MGSHNGTVDHRVFVVGIDSQQCENADPHAAFSPPAPSPMSVVPIAEARGKVPPGDTGAVSMDHRIDEPAIIRGRDADRSRPSGQTIFDQVPLVIAELVGAHGVSFRWS